MMRKIIAMNMHALVIKNSGVHTLYKQTHQTPKMYTGTLSSSHHDSEASPTDNPKEVKKNCTSLEQISLTISSNYPLQYCRVQCLAHFTRLQCCAYY